MPEAPPTPRPRKRPSEPGTTGTPGTGARERASSPPGDMPPEPGRTAPRAASPGRKAPLQKSLEELFAAPALIYSMTGDQVAATFVAGRAEPLAEAWYNLSRESPAVKRILERLTTGSAWGGVAVATGATVLPLLVHHDLLPFELPFGIPDPEGEGGPVVPPPPPPSAGGPASGGNGGRPGGGAATSRNGSPSGMTPPMRDGDPPGVVTVAGSNSHHR